MKAAFRLSLLAVLAAQVLTMAVGLPVAWLALAARPPTAANRPPHPHDGAAAVTTSIGLSDARIDAIIRDHEADPDGAGGDQPHTFRELVQAAREIRASRAELHRLRNRVGPFASATEAIRTLANRGLVALPPSIVETLDDCHRIVIEMATPTEEAP